MYISCKTPGGKFAKALQKDLVSKTSQKVWRVNPVRANFHQRRGKPVFTITLAPLNKVEQLERFKQAGVNCPPFTTSRQGLAELGSKSIFARQLINSTGGKGIVEFDLGEQRDIPNAPLYTAYIPKKAEYRIHIFNGEVIDIQQKKKKREFEKDSRDTRIRNLKNGYVYTRGDIDPPTGMGDLAIRAVRSLGYQYGAVDIIYNEKQNKCFVLEVNSRPGLMGTTLERYSDAIIKAFNLKRK